MSIPAPRWAFLLLLREYGKRLIVLALVQSVSSGTSSHKPNLPLRLFGTKRVPTSIIPNGLFPVKGLATNHSDNISGDCAVCGIEVRLFGGGREELLLQRVEVHRGRKGTGYDLGHQLYNQTGKAAEGLWEGLARLAGKGRSKDRGSDMGKSGCSINLLEEAPLISGIRPSGALGWFGR